MSLRSAKEKYMGFSYIWHTRMLCYNACYRKQTAYNASENIIGTTMTYTSLRFTTTTSASKRTGIFEDLYIFCNKERNKIKGKW